MKKSIALTFAAVITLLVNCDVLAQSVNDIKIQEGRIVKIRDPIDKSDVATKNYVDNKIEGIESPPIVLQTKGQSETAVMSQKATTFALEEAVNNSLENPLVSSGVNQRIKNAISELLSSDTIFDMIYPVGSIYMSVNSVNPSTTFGGSWVSWGSGRVPVGINTNDSDFNYAEKEGGEKSHTLNIYEIPSHSHGILMTQQAGHTAWGSTTTFSGGESDYNANYCAPRGGNQSHNNLQPYIVCYMWKRIA